ncbi:hypothetical protein GCM10010400_38020 [Streptomyces aculeolatus]|uniref:hypothetical protein n=1 Tax=Streptomyces aculeolatus TaxID=270689 RepID=UPI001CECB6C5|nr:hypothetical protein [Streptomyces aculeolatus]
MSMPHPAFELYDSVGPTTEPVTAHRENRPGADDLHRWTAHDARESELHLFPETAAKWCECNQEPGIAARSRKHAGQMTAQHSYHQLETSARKFAHRFGASLSKAVNTRRTSSTAPAGSGSKTAMRTQPRRPFPSRQV